MEIWKSRLQWSAWPINNKNQSSYSQHVWEWNPHPSVTTSHIWAWVKLLCAPEWKCCPWSTESEICCVFFCWSPVFFAMVCHLCSIPTCHSSTWCCFDRSVASQEDCLLLPTPRIPLVGCVNLAKKRVFALLAVHWELYRDVNGAEDVVLKTRMMETKCKMKGRRCDGYQSSKSLIYEIIGFTLRNVWDAIGNILRKIYRKAPFFPWQSRRGTWIRCIGFRLMLFLGKGTSWKPEIINPDLIKADRNLYLFL